MKNCVFCQIAKKEINSLIVGENELSLAFLDIHPLSPGHTLVIPKEHKTRFSQLEKKEILLLMNLVREISVKIESNLKADGFTLGINDGKAAGQAIDHFHFHIIPRYFNDGGHSIHSVVNFPPQEPLEEIYKKIKL